MFGKKLCGSSCGDSCGDSCCETECCDADPCEIAKLIYESQTACYAKDRRDAIDELGDDYNCRCNPEIICAMVYALNDTDERVRKEAADEIGDQIRKHGCCCTPEVVAALTCALGDCDKGVRKQAEEALEACGYEIVDGCCSTCGDVCGDSCAPASHEAPAESAPMKKTAPPAPPADKEANFKSKLNIRSAKSKSRLANLFGLAR
ncbi:MAG: HEAT repeat domain-containing protein [Planctomycetaceae bacterium]|nr:HEAT repeat domain-containing protein [Planctomycetaceae bacterium]